jgi:hypothetical protein
MDQPTYDDVNLILKLYELRREAKMRDARNWFVANFKCKTVAEFSALCPPGSDANASFRQVASYWDMCGSFVNAGVLNGDLFFANTRELLLCWVRLSPVIAEMRTTFGDPQYFANLEKAGKACADWFIRTSGQAAYDGFLKRVGG